MMAFEHNKFSLCWEAMIEVEEEVKKAKVKPD